ncbi:MAG TPA: DUF5335 family protein [Pantanalinema sp.]
MATRVIPVDQWLDYLNGISVLKRRAKVSVELKSDAFGDRLVADNLPLLGITPEMKGSEACAVDIEVGSQRAEQADRLTHSVICTTKLVVEEDDASHPREIDICGEDPRTKARVTTVIRFL